MPSTDRFGRLQPSKDGMWTKVAGKRAYRHWSGVVVAYNCNRWHWEIEGAGRAYKTLSVAQLEAERMYAEDERAMRPDGVVDDCADWATAQRLAITSARNTGCKHRVIKRDSATFPWRVERH